MRVALVADIHGNLPALEAVMAHAREKGTEAIWNAGDSVVYGPFPDEVVQYLRSAYALSALGDDDRRVLRFRKRQDKWRKSTPLEEYLSIQWTYEQLTKQSRRYLRFLSREVRLKVQGRRVYLTHGCTGSLERCLSSETGEKELRQIAGESQAELIVTGHLHKPFAHVADDVWFVNPGSAGLPDDGDPRVSYAIMEFDADSVRVQHYRVEYDVDRVVKAVQDRGLPPIIGQIFQQARSLDDLTSNG